jgi:hypothetical protein
MAGPNLLQGLTEELVESLPLTSVGWQDGCPVVDGKKVRHSNAMTGRLSVI